MLAVSGLILLLVSAPTSLALFVNSPAWDALNTTVGGRLVQGIPFARSCFPLVSNDTGGNFDEQECDAVKSDYLDHCKPSLIFFINLGLQFQVLLASKLGGYMNVGCIPLDAFLRNSIQKRRLSGRLASVPVQNAYWTRQIRPMRKLTPHREFAVRARSLNSGFASIMCRVNFQIDSLTDPCRIRQRRPRWSEFLERARHPSGHKKFRGERQPRLRVGNN
jgi:hypothetical protein